MRLAVVCLHRCDASSQAAVSCLLSPAVANGVARVSVPLRINDFLFAFVCAHMHTHMRVCARVWVFTSFPYKRRSSLRGYSILEKMLCISQSLILLIIIFFFFLFSLSGAFLRLTLGFTVQNVCLNFFCECCLKVLQDLDSPPQKINNC